eukprot:scaffold103723_cov63-Phaeocystis_antarctica.AAC.8
MTSIAIGLILCASSRRRNRSGVSFLPFGRIIRWHSCASNAVASATVGRYQAASKRQRLSVSGLEASPEQAGGLFGQ